MKPLREDLPAVSRTGRIHVNFLRWLKDLVRAVPERFVAVEISAAYTARAWDFVLLDASGGGFTVTLPADPQPGEQVAVSEAAGSANNVVFNASTGTTIMGAASATYNTADDGFLLILAGTDWRRVG